MEPSEVNFDRHWHLDKRLNIGHLLTTLSLAGAIFIWASAIEKRVSVHDAELEILKIANKEAISLLRDELREVRNEIRYLRNELTDERRANNGRTPQGRLP